MNFCRLPPDRLLRRRAGPAGLDVEAARSACAASARDVARCAASRRGRPARVRVSSVFCASDSVGTAPRPSRSSGTKCRPRARGAGAAMARAMSLAEQADRAAGRARGPRPTARPSAPAGRCPRRRRCRRSRRRAPRSEIAVEAGAERVVLRQRRGRAPRAPPRRRCAARCCSCGGSAPIIRRDRLALLSCVGIDLAGDLAAAQHRAVVAERADLVELVADVEDRAAFGGELAQRDEQRLAPPAASAPRSARRGSAASGSVSSARTISTRWRSPTDSVCTGRSGSTSRP